MSDSYKKLFQQVDNFNLNSTNGTTTTTPTPIPTTSLTMTTNSQRLDAAVAAVEPHMNRHSNSTALYDYTEDFFLNDSDLLYEEQVCPSNLFLFWLFYIYSVSLSLLSPFLFFTLIFMWLIIFITLYIL
jgi:hypothetical protein